MVTLCCEAACRVVKPLALPAPVWSTSSISIPGWGEQIMFTCIHAWPTRVTRKRELRSAASKGLVFDLPRSFQLIILPLVKPSTMLYKIGKTEFSCILILSCNWSGPRVALHCRFGKYSWSQWFSPCSTITISTCKTTHSSGEHLLRKDISIVWQIAIELINFEFE